jgi:hypothetical protein
VNIAKPGLIALASATTQPVKETEAELLKKLLPTFGNDKRLNVNHCQKFHHLPHLQYHPNKALDVTTSKVKRSLSVLTVIAKSPLMHRWAFRYK